MVTNRVSPEINADVRRLAEVLWDYHYLELDLEPSDFILALGSHDRRVARHAAQLILDNYAPLLVTSGGFGKVTQTNQDVAEGEQFAEIAVRLGVPKSKILIEAEAKNTGENITKTRDLLLRNKLSVTSGMLVTKPYMRRRAYATAAKQWPEIRWLVSSPNMSFDEYPDLEVPEETMIQLMVGDLQRIRLYAENGFQAPQDIPDDVWGCYEELVRRGFNKYVIKPKE